jgi:UDPglucose 6-dehydrogenase
VPDLKGKTVGVGGLAFKPNSDDIRETRAIPIVEALLEEGAKVIGYDPLAIENFKEIFPNLEYTSSAKELLDKTEIIIIQTEWDEFEKQDYSGKIVIDGRLVESARKTAKIYEGICW